MNTRFDRPPYIYNIYIFIGYVNNVQNNTLLHNRYAYFYHHLTYTSRPILVTIKSPLVIRSSSSLYSTHSLAKIVIKNCPHSLIIILPPCLIRQLADPKKVSLILIIVFIILLVYLIFIICIPVVSNFKELNCLVDELLKSMIKEFIEQDQQQQPKLYLNVVNPSPGNGDPIHGLHTPTQGSGSNLLSPPSNDRPIDAVSKGVGEVPDDPSKVNSSGTNENNKTIKKARSLVDIFKDIKEKVKESGDKVKETSKSIRKSASSVFSKDNTSSNLPQPRPFTPEQPTVTFSNVDENLGVKITDSPVEIKEPHRAQAQADYERSKNAHDVNYNYQKEWDKKKK